MPKLRLTTAEQRVLVAAQLDAEQSVAALSKRTKLRSHVVNHALSQLLSRGILRRGAMINISKIGLEQWILYLALGSRKPSERNRVLNWLSNDARVLWYGELGGEYQIGTAFNVRHGTEVGEFVTAVTSIYGGSYRKKALARTISFTALSKNYIMESPSLFPREMVEVKDSYERTALDLNDQKILNGLFSNDARSRPALAKKLGIARSTLEYRISRMKDQGILQREIYFLSAQRLGLLLYRLPLTLRGLDDQNAKLIVEFCRNEAEVVNITRCLGAWDFELAIEVREPRHALELLDRISQRFQDEIVDLTLIPVFAQGTSSKYLMPTKK